MEEKKIRATLEQLEQFMASTVFLDYCDELDNRIEMLTNMLIDDSLEYTGRFYDQLRGGIKNMSQMKMLFEDLKHNKQIQLGGE